MTSFLESQNKKFIEASAMVLAASDLLKAASKASSEQFSRSLDNNTLQTLAQAIYNEAQVAEMLYIQLHEMYEQVRCEHVELYSSHPQIAIPLSKLNLSQLQQLLHVSETKLETLAPEAGEFSDYSNQGTLEQLHRTIKDIQTEITNHE